MRERGLALLSVILPLVILSGIVLTTFVSINISLESQKNSAGNIPALNEMIERENQGERICYTQRAFQLNQNYQRERCELKISQPFEFIRQHTSKSHPDFPILDLSAAPKETLRCQTSWQRTALSVNSVVATDSCSLNSLSKPTTILGNLVSSTGLSINADTLYVHGRVELSSLTLSSETLLVSAGDIEILQLSGSGAAILVSATGHVIVRSSSPLISLTSVAWNGTAAPGNRWTPPQILLPTRDRLTLSLN